MSATLLVLLALVVPRPADAQVSFTRIFEGDIANERGHFQGCAWGDYDNDGYVDLFIANGDPHHLYVEEANIARCDGKGKFIDMARQSGDFFDRKYVGRGAAFADFDNDGDIDILMNTINDLPRLLRNDGGNRQNWLEVVPLRKDTGMVAIGGEVKV